MFETKAGDRTLVYDPVGSAINTHARIVATVNNIKRKLELTWVGKEDRPRLEPRILVEDSKLSHGDPNAGNMLIQGDNLLALKALEQDFSGKIKCIFIDPPYNTGSAFAHYDDGLEHSIWLSMMRDRLVILRNLLTQGHKQIFDEASEDFLGGNGKADGAKLPGVGILPKPCPRKSAAEKGKCIE